MEAAHNWWIKARAVLSETTSRGEQNPQRRYKLLGHVLIKMPMLAVIRATYGVRSSPVGLNVTRHFAIARTQQQLLMTMTTKRS